MKDAAEHGAVTVNGFDMLFIRVWRHLKYGMI